MIMKFSDGISLDTSGELRVEWRRDGYYVLGNGMSIPVNDEEEGERIIARMKKTETK